MIEKCEKYIYACMYIVNVIVKFQQEKSMMTNVVGEAN
jgi:hypothetical protein